MRPAQRSALAVFIALIVGAAGATVAFAAHGEASPAASPVTSPVASRAAVAASPAGVIQGLILKTSVVSQNGGSAVLAAGFQPLDKVTVVTCAGPGTCTIEADQHAQVISGVAGNSWALCTTVDGFDMTSPPCPFFQPLAKGGYATGAFAQTQQHVAAGTHKVQTLLFSDHGLTRYIYSIDYRIFKP